MKSLHYRIKQKTKNILFQHLQNIIMTQTLDFVIQKDIQNLNLQLKQKSYEIQEISLQNLRLNDEVQKLNEQLKSLLKVNKHSKEFSQQIEIIQDKLLQNKSIIQMQDNQLQVLQQQSIKDKKQLQQRYLGIIDQLNEDYSKIKLQLDQSQNKICYLEVFLIKRYKNLMKNILSKIKNQNNIFFNSSQKINQESSRSSDYMKSQVLDKVKSENQQYQQEIYVILALKLLSQVRYEFQNQFGKQILISFLKRNKQIQLVYKVIEKLNNQLKKNLLYQLNFQIFKFFFLNTPFCKSNMQVLQIGVIKSRTD
ncbi:unnamed protein product [Paramecium sonneborni]|uniref:Uncharacterized protein n=1 Tax=Paramecium sonneborni TaxID=65129 RepID=A0A8S1RL14_9CILI|nr:unnamed protein product [Paramecium sonneborni]